MADPPRSDNERFQKGLTRLIVVIACALVSLLVLTFWLYARFTRGITVTP